MCLMQYVGHFTNYWAVVDTKTCSKHLCQAFMMKRFTKIIIPECSRPEIFQSRKDFVELGHFDVRLAKSTRKKGPAKKYFGVFSPWYS